MAHIAKILIAMQISSILGPLLLRKRKMEITVASEPPPKRPIIQAMADKNKRQATFLH